MRLRLALQGPFRFLPAPPVNYEVAASGRFLSSVLTGESEAGVVIRISGQLLAFEEGSVLRTYLPRAIRQARGWSA